MRILVVAATEQELVPHRNLLSKYRYVSCEVTGIGQTLTAYHLTKLLATQKYDLVINTGIAGYYSPNLEIGDTVLVSHDIFADLGIGAPGKFIDLFEAGFLAANEFPFTHGWLECPYLAQYPLPLLPVVRSITVNTSSGNAGDIQKLIRKYSPDIESMEGAACFYVCLREKIPFLQIRTLSNKVEIRNTNNWNIPLAINNSGEVLEQFIQQITNYTQ